MKKVVQHFLHNVLSEYTSQIKCLSVLHRNIRDQLYGQIFTSYSYTINTANSFILVFEFLGFSVYSTKSFIISMSTSSLLSVLDSPPNKCSLLWNVVMFCHTVKSPSHNRNEECIMLFS